MDWSPSNKWLTKIINTIELLNVHVTNILPFLLKQIAMDEKFAGLQDQINKISVTQEKQNSAIEKLLSFLQEGEDEPDNASDSDDQQNIQLSGEPIASGSNDTDPITVQENKEGAETTSGDDTMTEEQKPNESLWTQRSSKYRKEIQTAKAVAPDLADYVSQAVTNKPDNKKLEQLLSHFHRPINIPFLTVPRTNIECWRLMPQAAQTADKQVQQLQTKVVGAMTPLVHALEELSKPEPSLNTIKDTVIHSFELLANMQMDFNLTRKENARPHLHKAAHLANKDTPVTESLFGDDVEAEMKRVEVATKLHQNMKATDKHKYKRQQFREKAKAFLGYQGGQTFASPGFKRPYPRSNQQHSPQQHQSQNFKYQHKFRRQGQTQQMNKKGSPSQWKLKRKQ